MKVPSKINAVGDYVPIITNEMKAVCIGEFKMTIEVGCFSCMGDGCDECDNTGESTQDFDIPWTTMKEIYKMMAKVASGSVEQ